MSALFASFPATSKEEWVQLLQKELKGASPDALQKFNRIEEISFPSYFHREDAGEAFADPGHYPFTRGYQTDSNDWHIGTCFRITDEVADNKLILQALMAGTTALVIHATDDREIRFELLLQEVGLEYIHLTFFAKNNAQAESFAAFAGHHPSAIVCENSASWLEKAGQFAGSALKPFTVNAYAAQQAGATTWQEIGLALAEGHELLYTQIESGVAPLDAAANLHFLFGIGNQYFYEIAKFRAFRTAWSRIVSAYTGDTDHIPAFVTAQTGFVHTSLKDPYTNLLRQTTEAMSAVTAGVQQLVIQPYDWHATQPQTTFTRRMATNISLLLKEESYLDKVIDPAGGSYAIDDLTNAIAERTWATFREIEASGGITQSEARTSLQQAISEKAQQRLVQVNEKQTTLIGINVFPNPEKTDNDWQEIPVAWNGLTSLIIESELLNA